MDHAEIVVAVVVASAGRPEVLADVVADVDAQTHPIRHRVLSVPDGAACPREEHRTVGWW